MSGPRVSSVKEDAADLTIKMRTKTAKWSEVAGTVGDFEEPCPS